ncbi:protein of unknown function [Tepidibacter aestuarii]|nr:protein of unknown function [Tepidibacter aestuarii]
MAYICVEFIIKAIYFYSKNFKNKEGNKDKKIEIVRIHIEYGM